MAFHTYTLPVLRQNLLQQQVIDYVNVPLGVWDTGLGDGNMAMQAILGYLTKIWHKTCVPIQSQSITEFPIEGEGNYSFAETFYGAQISLARIRLDYVPEDIDMRFGANPLVYVGQCAFTRENPPFQVTGGGFTFQLGASLGGVARYPLKWINYPVSMFVPDHPNCTGFWWNLKPGVRATIHLEGMELGRGVGSDCFAAYDELFACEFNPMNYLGVPVSAPPGPGG